MFKRICMIGLGYIGLPTATLFASRHIEVLGVDISQRVVDTINKARIHIVEPELDVLVRQVVEEGWLRASTVPEPADVFLIAVPTPFRDGHRPDVSYIEAAARAIAPVLRPGNLVVLESTSPVGTTDRLADWLAEARADLSFPQQAGDTADIQLAHCPERVLPGRVVRELVSNDRVIGGMSAVATHMASELYRIFVEGELVGTDARTAEMCKLVENSYRDVNIAFANELSVICDRLNIDVWELVALANRHPRVNILQPGTGVGGHCIAVDPWFIVDSSPETARLIRAAREINDHKPDWVLDKIKAAILEVLAQKPGRSIDDVKVACLGLTFKPDIDDLRESPAVGLVDKLGHLGCKVLAVEPNIFAMPSRLARANLSLVALADALACADVVCVLVKHGDFLRQREQIAAHRCTVDAVGLLSQKS